MSNKLVSGKQFQSTLPRGERRSLQGILLWFSYFNPHSHEGSDLIISKQITIDTYFNPHSHEGSDLYADINTPPLVYFNPHSHEGSDPLKSDTHQTTAISIHTPTRGATILQIYRLAFLLFQSTLPRGERQTSNARSIPLLYFNPHSHEGSDASKPFNPSGKTISIHTPTRGATYTDADSEGNRQISIHTPTRGATCRRTYHADAFRISIHTPTRGATMEKPVHIVIIRFQSTLPRGERLLKLVL